VHPWFGELVHLIGRAGPDTVRVERGGERRLVPTEWLDLEPRPEPLTSGGRSVPLSPDAAIELARWTNARLGAVTVGRRRAALGKSCEKADDIP